MDTPILSGTGSEATSVGSESDEENNAEEAVHDEVEGAEESNAINEEEEKPLQAFCSLICRITTLYDMHDEDWTNEAYHVIRYFALTACECVLVIYYCDTILIASLHFPSTPVHDLMYYIKREECVVSTDNFFEMVTFGNMNSCMEGSVLNLLQNIYVPTIFENSSWPEGVKSELFSKFHECLAHLTDLHYKMFGLTILYVPGEGLKFPVEEASKQKELLRRIEGVMVQWLKQLRVTVSDTFESNLNMLLTPIDDYLFWEYRWECLMLLNHQLDDPSVKHTLDVLTLAQSSYLQQFKDLQNEMKYAIDQAASNIEYLKILVDPCREMALERSVEKINNHVPNLLNLIRKLWISSPYYNTAAQLVPLCCNLTNQVIIQCRKLVDIDGIFDNAKTRTAIAALKSNIACCQRFKMIYLEMASFHTECLPNVPWALDESLVFGNMDSFVRRCYDLIEICQAMITFGWLEEEEEERPILGGTKGKDFAKVVNDVESQFQTALLAIFKVRSNILDVMNLNWHVDMLEFRNKLEELEMVLTNLLDSVTKESSTVEELLYSLYAFHHYTQRPGVFRLFEQKTIVLWQTLLNEVHEIRQQVMLSRPIRQAKTPSHAGSAMAAHIPRLRLQHLKKLLTEASWLPKVRAGTEVLIQLDYVLERIETIGKTQNSQWNNKIEDNAVLRLSRPLIRRSTHRPGLLETNFDLVLKNICHEAEFWSILERNIAQPGEEVTSKWPKIRLLYENVCSVVLDYNKIISALSDEERLLFKELIGQVDHKMSVGLFKLNWTVEVFDDYIGGCNRANDQLYTFIQEYKKAIYDVMGLCENICETKLLCIAPGTAFELAELEEHIEAYRTNAFIKIMEIYQQILKHLVIVHDGFEDVIPATGIHWHKFILKLDEMLKQSLLMCVKDSMQAMLDALKGDFPLLSVTLHLEKQKIAFHPSLWKVSSLGNHFLSEVVGAFKVIPRIYDKLKLQWNNPPPFHSIVDSDPECIELQVAINKEVSENVTKIQNYLIAWEPYRKIWDTNYDIIIKEYQERNPDSIDWESDISGFDEVAKQVMGEEALLSVHFTRLDAGPLKIKICQLCNEWKDTLCQVLLNKSVGAIDRIFKHCDDQASSTQEDPKNLEDLKSSLNNFDILQGTTAAIEAEIPRIEEQFKILMKYEVRIPPDVSRKRQKVSKRWKDYQISVKATNEMLDRCKDTIQASLLEVAEGRKAQISNLGFRFKENGPYSCKWNSTDALKYIADLSEQVIVLETLEEELHSSLEFFDISHPASTELEHLMENLHFLQNSWQLIRDWETKWREYKDINFLSLHVESLEYEVSDFLNHFGMWASDHESRGWNIFDEAIAQIEAIKASLPLIAELKNPALRDRHWLQIQGIVRKSFDHCSSEFSFEAALNMKLYEYGTAIFDVSKTATLELGFENSLKNIKEAWETNIIKLEPFKEVKGVYRVLQVDELLQNIEEHQTTLAAMKGTKYVKPFLNDVSICEKNITLVDEVLDLLLNSQRQWIYLENIFVGDDIRLQLPQQAAVFDNLTSLWRELTSRMNEEKNALRISRQSNIIKQLNSMLKAMEDIEKTLAEYLENKRSCFPRFYFISNDDLLEILGHSKKPTLVQPHLKNVFDNIVNISLGQSAGKQEIISMISGDGEEITLSSPVSCDCPVEEWLAQLEAVMRVTLKQELKSTRITLRKALSKRDKWIKEQVGQLCIISSQIQWSTDCTKALMSCHYSNSRLPLKKVRRKQKKLLNTFSDLLRTPLTKILRLKVVAMVTIEIHARDVLELLYKGNCTDVNDFKWSSQLRFYWDKSGDDCHVRQTNTSFKYGYEYLGNSGRLAVTPLTDRCYITLTTALHMHRGGSPKGPAGTGKTETVKDLGKALGAFVLVFNCSEGLDYKSMGRLFSGIAQSGCWGCFDEFNRINVEVLSVVAQQILSILDALSINAKTLIFQGNQINLNPTCGIFITMNPGYAGRTDLPDNLKAVFRPISMVVPDSAIIAEVTFYAEGFRDGQTLSNKVVALFNLSQQQLSKQDHYDFGLRGLISLLRYAGVKRRELVRLSDSEVVLVALQEINMAKLTSGDVGIFLALIRDLFPIVETPLFDVSDFRNAVINQMKKSGLQPIPAMVKKVVQLHETQSSRHSVMLVGETCTGKSTTWKTLKETLSQLASADGKYQPVTEYPINPKTLTLTQLFGQFNLATGEWEDGVVSAIMRNVCSDEGPTRKWVLFDGPVDAVWIENMNSAMDDNKVLTLINSERINMPEQVSFLFEVENLSEASPATVSRAGMVYTDYSDLLWQPYVDSWLQKITLKTISAELKQHFQRVLPRVLEFKQRHCKELVTTHELGVVKSLCNLLQCFCINDLSKCQSEDDIPTLVKLQFMFCLTWSVCSTLDEDGRRKIDAYIRETDNVFPLKGTIYDYFVDVRQQNMVGWETKLDDHWKYNQSLSFHEIVVPTVDTVRYQCLMEALLALKEPILLTGPVGVGKTCLMQRQVHQQGGSVLCASLSASASAQSLQELLESRLEKRTKGIYAPIGGQSLAVLLDDFNMPSPDVYGSQPPLELIRHWFDYGFWYDRQKQWKKHIKDMVITAAMGPFGGGRNKIPNRLLSCFNILAVTAPDQEQISRIYLSILRQHLSTFDENVKSIAEPITNMTVELFFAVIKLLLPTPTKTHYLFHLRDISRVFEGLLRSHNDYQNTSKRLASLWIHEVHRVFSDRLVNKEDQEIFSNKLDEILRTYMDANTSTFFPDKIIPPYGNFMNTHRRYEEMNVGSLRTHIEQMQEEFNKQPGVAALNLVLFRDAVEHVCRIARVMSQNRGHLLLVGLGGSGRSSLSRLALHLSGLRLSTIVLTSNYNVQDFRESLKHLYRLTGIDARPTAFFFSDNQIVVDEFLEIINSILGTGEVPNLFRAEELEEIRNSLTPVAEKEGRTLTSDATLPFFIERSRRNLHVILAMNPADLNFRPWLMRYPSLISCTTINWFLPWPKEALVEVAQYSLADCSFTQTIFTNSEKRSDERKDETCRSLVADIFAEIYGALQTNADGMWNEFRRKVYITPTNYLHFISTYISLLNEKRHTVREAAMKLKNGLGKIDEARGSVEEMTIELEKSQAKVLIVQEECEAALAVMGVKKREADEQAKKVKLESEQIAEEEATCRALAQAAQDDLDEALPALEEAMLALESLSKKDISELKSYGRPPPKVMLVMEAVCILKGVPPDWTESKRILGEQNFLKSLKEFDKDHISENTMLKIASYTELPEFSPEDVESVSQAAKSLCMWVLAIENYGKLWRIVGPKKARVEDASATLRRKQEDVALLKSHLDEINLVITKLNEEYMQKSQEMDRLKAEEEGLQLKLTRAGLLVDGLAEENLRWQSTVIDLESQFNLLAGDCILASAFLSAAGPFLSTYRFKFLDDCRNIVATVSSEIPSTIGLKVVEFLVDPALVRDWGDIGLPMDDFNVENGILVVTSSRSPLLIDPQMQGNKWVKKLECANNLTVIDGEEPNLRSILENCILSGTPILLQNISETISPIVIPILCKNLIYQGGELQVNIGDKCIPYNTNFRIYASTKLNNPNFPIEVSTKTTVVNFSVKREGLEAQMLSVVVRRERPELEDLKTATLQTLSVGRKTLTQLENDLLVLLCESKGSLLENDALFKTLQDSRIVSTNIKEGIKTAEVTEREINEARLKYMDCATRAAILFVALNDLSQVDAMYQFSLDAYIRLFLQSLEKSGKSHMVATRVASIIDYHTYAVYRNVCCTLFTRHRLLFSFYICVCILEIIDKNVRTVFNHLLKRDVILKRDREAANPDPSWISDSLWEAVVNLESVPQFHGILESFRISSHLWKEWYFHSTPEKGVLPDKWSNLASSDRLLLIKALREDRLCAAISVFVEDTLGSRFTDPPIFDLRAIYEESTPTSPLILILSPGVDPSASLVQFAKEKEVADSMLTLSLGQGQSELATQYIRRGSVEGRWVYLANCHLSLSWMPTLDKIVEKLKTDPEVDPKFRLWLSSKPHHDFPISILQDGIKITTEPPQGIRNNLTRLYQLMTPARFEECASAGPVKYSRLCFALSFFHAVLLERRKFDNLGWNIFYSFNDSDFEVSERLLNMYLNDYEEVPWDAIKYLIAEVNYGGHVTDMWDRRVLLTYASQYFCPDLLTQTDFRFSSSEEYVMADKDTLEGIREHISNLPNIDAAEVFGQHMNAEINHLILDSRMLCDTLLSISFQTRADESHSMEQTAFAIADDVMSQLPQAINAGFSKGNPNPLDVVLMQECERYNNLLSSIFALLTDLQGAIVGRIVMSEELSQIFSNLISGKIPVAWLKAYPSLKSLGSWTLDLAKRVGILQNWASTSPPSPFWLPTFTFPSGFLTAVLQQTSRKNNVPVDLLSWQIEVLRSGAEYTTDLPDDGVLVEGLFLEGASWDSDRMCLCDPIPLQLISSMPVVWFKPSEKIKSKGKGLYNCPTYYYPVRSESFVVALNLPCGTLVPPEAWIKRGTALLLSTDT